MTQTTSSLWARYRAGLVHDARTGFSLDVSRMDLPDAPHPRTDAAFDAMEALENGAIANPDEQRMVGHYWLRDADRAPNAELRAQVTQPLEALEKFAADVHAGKIVGEKGEKFSQVLVVGIGGSALGPQFVAQALTRGPATDPAKSFFFDNTDPDGFDKVLEQLGGVVGLARTLTVVISKSGGTKETRNGMVEAAAAYARAGLHFSRHAVAVTGENSELDKVAKKGEWLATFPMYDWIGGRTSELSAVGLLPAALQGFDVRAMLRGAKEMDALTRVRDAKKNPAMVLANAWFHATGGKGQKDMVVLPYKDRLELFSRYLQQLVMESLGKEKDLAGETAHQGIAVYGNKGSTDQHAYVQQLRDGVPNFFVTFIEVLRDRDDATRDFEVEPGVTAGDYLLGFLEGTRRALYEAGRHSITVTIPRADAHGVGMLIALYERTVGFYATLVNINAYHQPGVEAGKKAAAAVLTVQGKAIRALQKSGKALTAEEVASEAGIDDPETVFKILRHLSANPHRGVHALDEASGDPGAVRFTLQTPAK